MTSRDLIKKVAGWTDSSGITPKITFEPLNYRNFKTLVAKLWQSIVLQQAVQNPDSICPLHLFLEYSFAQLRTYALHHFYQVWQDLGKLDPAPNGWFNDYFPSFSPSQLKGFTSKPCLEAVLGLIRHVLRPQYHQSTGQVYLKYPPCCTIYQLGFYPDNRQSMTSIELQNSISAGRISKLGLWLGIPMRLSVYDFIHRTFCQSWPRYVVNRREILNFDWRTYRYVRGPLSATHAMVVPNAGIGAQNRNVPWEADYFPNVLPPHWSWFSTGFINGVTADTFPAEVRGNRDLRPWHLVDNIFISTLTIPIHTLRTCRSWPPFSSDPDDWRAQLLEAIVGNAMPNPHFNVSRNCPSLEMEPIPLRAGVIDCMMYTADGANVTPVMVQTQRMCPNITYYRPTGQDAIPPLEIENFQNSMGLDAYRAQLIGSWQMFDAIPYSIEASSDQFKQGDTVYSHGADWASGVVSTFDQAQWPRITDEFKQGGLERGGLHPGRKRNPRNKGVHTGRKSLTSPTEPQVVTESDPKDRTNIHSTDISQSAQQGKGRQKDRKKKKKKNKKDAALPSHPAANTQAPDD